jgi:hypothetical protein
MVQLGDMSQGDSGAPAAGTIRNSAGKKFRMDRRGPGLGKMVLGYMRHAEVTVPLLVDWEKGWQENPQRSVQTIFATI